MNKPDPTWRVCIEVNEDAARQLFAEYTRRMNLAPRHIASVTLERGNGVGAFAVMSRLTRDDMAHIKLPRE